MKLETPEVNVTKSDDFKEESFGIGDVSLILNILRSKMYSSPIKAICQEVTSNARDAHRELGKSELPIEVKLPNNLNCTFEVADFGPGISPERMTDVVIKYGNSTKRDSNEQTGGFGLGFKTPWAYSDTFTIISNTEENGKVISRVYTAYIGEDQKGTLSLLHSYEDENGYSGVRVKVPVKPQDTNRFGEFIHDVCLYWNPKPIIKGNHNFEWTERSVLESGDNWFIEGQHKGSNNLNPFRSTRSIKAIIDGIQYPITTGYLESHINERTNASRIKDVLASDVRLLFEVGELSLSANRESLDYNDKTILAIIDRLEEVIQDINNKLSDEVNKKSDLFQAAKYVAELRGSLGSNLVKDVEWNNIKIDHRLNITHKSQRVSLFEFESDNGYPRTRWLYNASLTDFDSFIIDDTGNVRPSKLRLETLIDQGYDNGLVIRFVDVNARAEFYKDYPFLNHIDPVYLSNIERKAKKHSRQQKNYTPASVYKINSRLDKYTNFDLYQNVGIFVKFKKNIIYLKDGTIIRDRVKLKQLKNHLNIDIYAIPERNIDDALQYGWQWLTDYIKNNLSNIKQKLDIDEIIPSHRHTTMQFNGLDTLNPDLVRAVDIGQIKLPQDSCLEQLFHNSKELNDVRSKLNNKREVISAILDIVDCNEFEASNFKAKQDKNKRLYNECIKYYPLIQHMRFFQPFGRNHSDSSQEEMNHWQKYLNKVFQGDF